MAADASEAADKDGVLARPSSLVPTQQEYDDFSKSSDEDSTKPALRGDEVVIKGPLQPIVVHIARPSHHLLASAPF